MGCGITTNANSLTSGGFGLVVVCVACDAVDDADEMAGGRFTILFPFDGCGFFVGFGFGLNGFSHEYVGFGFVIKFGCVVTCHCVV